MNEPTLGKFGVIGKLLLTLDQKGYTPEKLQALLESAALSDLLDVDNPEAIDRFIHRASLGLGVISSIRSYRQVVDYQRFFLESSFAAISLRFGMQDMTERFLAKFSDDTQPRVKTDYELEFVQFATEMSTADAFGELVQRAIYPVPVYPLLAMSNNVYEDKFKKNHKPVDFKIVVPGALSHPWRSNQQVLVVRGVYERDENEQVVDGLLLMKLEVVTVSPHMVWPAGTWFVGIVGKK